MLSGCSAHAADIPYSKDYDRSIDASGRNTFSMIECTTAETARWDKRLNANYKSLMATLDTDRQKAFIAAEIAWLKFRAGQRRNGRELVRLADDRRALSNNQIEDFLSAAAISSVKGAIDDTATFWREGIVSASAKFCFPQPLKSGQADKPTAWGRSLRARSLIR